MFNLITRDEMFEEYTIRIEGGNSFGDRDFKKFYKLDKKTGYYEPISFSKFEEYMFCEENFIYEDDIKKFNPRLTDEENAFTLYYTNIQDINSELFKFFGFSDDHCIDMGKIDTMGFLIWLHESFNLDENFRHIKYEPTIKILKAAAKIGKYNRRLKNVIRAFWISASYFGRDRIIERSKRPIVERMWSINLNIFDGVDLSELEEATKDKSKYYKKARGIDISPTEEEKQILYEKKKLILTPDEVR